MSPRRAAAALSRRSDVTVRDRFIPASTAGPPPEAETASRRSLVICEDPERSARLAHEGASRGWIVESFVTAAAAERRIGERRFDVLTVCGSARASVVEAARSLHATHPQTPLVVVVDDADTAMRALAARSGVSEVVLTADGPSAVAAAWDAHVGARSGGAQVIVVTAADPGREAVERAFDAAGRAVRALRAGAVDCLVTPLSLTLFVARAERLLAGEDR